LKRPSHKTIVLDQHLEESTILDLEVNMLLAWLKPQPLISWHLSLYQFNFMSARQCRTQQWKQMLLLLLGILQFPLRLSPQESFHLLTHHHQSEPPWSQPTTTSHSGLISSLVAATTPFTPSATGPPFSYGMPSSGTSPVLSYSTLQTLGLGVGSYKHSSARSHGGTPAPFNAFPYRGGHIPPSFLSLSGSHQQSAGQPTHNSVFGAGSQGPPSHSMPVVSTLFSLNAMFGNNTFSSMPLSRLGATPFLDNLLLCRVLFLHRGKT
jgi:hypothetical protein